MMSLKIALNSSLGRNTTKTYEKLRMTINSKDSNPPIFVYEGDSWLNVLNQHSYTACVKYKICVSDNPNFDNIPFASSTITKVKE